MIKFTIPSTFVKQIFIPSFILLIGLAVLCSFFPIQIESNLANIQEYIFNNLSWVYILTVSTILILLLMIAFSKAGNLRLGPDNSRPQYGFMVCHVIFCRHGHRNYVFWCRRTFVSFCFTCHRRHRTKRQNGSTLYVFPLGASRLGCLRPHWLVTCLFFLPLQTSPFHKKLPVSNSQVKS